MTITRAQFEAAHPVLIATDRRGASVMAFDAHDAYQTDLGTVVHHWGNGGESFHLAESIWQDDPLRDWQMPSVEMRSWSGGAPWPERTTR